MSVLLVITLLAATVDEPPAALLGAAVQASDHGDYCQAERLFSAINERWPSARAIYNDAEVAYAAGDRLRALDLYREAQKLYPTERKDLVQKRADEVYRTMAKDGVGRACPVVPPTCGDWRITGAETCDDGNTDDGDKCDHNCTVTACGNGVLTAGELCDDGNVADGDGCDHTCVPTACGNGVVTAGEQCDDGNNVDGDGCDHTCTLTACGNGVRSEHEECDDGNSADGDGCDRGCKVSRCGNGVVAGGEQCDDGNTVNGDGCENTCTITRVPAPFTGTVTAVVSGAVAVVGGVLLTIGIVSASEHNDAVAKVQGLEGAYGADPQGSLDKVDAARNVEDRSFERWTTLGIPSLGAGAVLGVAGLAAAGYGTWLALTTTEPAPSGGGAQ